MNGHEDDAYFEKLTRLSKVMSKVLRHEPELVGLKLDPQGWVLVDALVSAINSGSRNASSKRLKRLGLVTHEMLEEVVRQNDKKRYALSGDGQRIRAVQGHSIEVELGYPAIEPPDVLYHGTTVDAWPEIDRAGLLPMARQQVHLSSDVATAERVGQRHGRPLVLVVAAALMHREGSAFYQADNGVWLVGSVPRRFITRLR